MKKLILMPAFLSLLSSIVLADFEDMMGSSGMMGGTFGMGFFGVIYFALAAFVFSIIFWLTYNWLVQDKKKRK